MIPKTDWKWYGLPGHFIGASRCYFHLCTVIGDYIISTVGHYHPRDDEPPQQIGLGRLYETMVFKGGRLCSCGCGMPTHNGRELECVGYNTVKDANDGHMVVCERYSNLG